MSTLRTAINACRATGYPAMPGLRHRQIKIPHRGLSKACRYRPSCRHAHHTGTGAGAVSAPAAEAVSGICHRRQHHRGSLIEAGRARGPTIDAGRRTAYHPVAAVGDAQHMGRRCYCREIGGHRLGGAHRDAATSRPRACTAPATESISGFGTCRQRHGGTAVEISRTGRSAVDAGRVTAYGPIAAIRYIQGIGNWGKTGADRLGRTHADRAAARPGTGPAPAGEAVTRIGGRRQRDRRPAIEVGCTSGTATDTGRVAAYRAIAAIADVERVLGNRAGR